MHCTILDVNKPLKYRIMLILNSLVPIGHAHCIEWARFIHVCCC